LTGKQLKDENIARKLDYGFLRYLTVILGLPIFIAGYLTNLIPFVVPRLICSTMIKDLRFYTSVYTGVGTMLYLIYFPVILILAGIFLGWPGLLAGLLVPVLGYLVLYYQEVAKERFHTLRYWLKKIKNPDLISDLRKQRADILSDLGKVIIKN
jgi:hypothetical protein